MFVEFKFSTMKTQVSAYWNLMQNLVFQFSVADFHFNTCFVGVNRLAYKSNS